MILFQYAQEIIGHAFLKSNGCVIDKKEKGYIGYYEINMESIIIYNNPVTKEEIYEIWMKKLGQAKLKLEVSKYDEYLKLLEKKRNL